MAHCAVAVSQHPQDPMLSWISQNFPLHPKDLQNFYKVPLDRWQAHLHDPSVFVSEIFFLTQIPLLGLSVHKTFSLTSSVQHLFFFPHVISKAL